MNELKGISSMATRLVLAELAEAFQRRSGYRVSMESVGGVDAARRVRSGEAFDVVFLASDAIDTLIASGHVRAGSRVNLVRSGVAIAVRAGSPKPDISTEEALRRAVHTARSVSYSTGPSGTALVKLFDRWGLTEELRTRIVQPAPGIPVGSLVASGEVELGFQQLSELMHIEGIAILGSMPSAIQIMTTFSGGVCAVSAQADIARALLDFMASPEALDAKLRQGMESAESQKGS